MSDPILTVKTTIKAQLDRVWDAYITPEDIKQWNAASDDWHTTRSEVDFRVGGQFSSRMEAKDGSFGFDFAGTYSDIQHHKHIAYVFGDRTATIDFTTDGTITQITVTFEAETAHSLEQQQAGWQAILDRFGHYVEGLNP